MCGIVGIYNFNGKSVDPQVLIQMTNVQLHRGPDDQGMTLFSLKGQKGISYEFKNHHMLYNKCEGGIGFNRLSILDVSQNGHQPMYNADSSIFIAFNGEIYNAFQYRPELVNAGFQFRSRTDTEIILYLYELYGFEIMLERLNGMFAICIVDLNRQEIYLARDRMGIKPLYWYEKDGTYLFSSEVKSFLYHPCFKAELNVDRLDEYFTFRYCAGDGFLLKGVKQLEPGQWIKLHPKGFTKHRYWIVPDVSNEQNLSFDSALQGLEKHLHRSTQLQMLSDVKLGCQLSGGIDSSLINIFACLYSGADLDAISIIFDDPEFSEGKWVEHVAALTKIKAHKFILDANYFLNNLGKATWHMDQPLNHPNSVGIFCLAEKARSLVTVLLSGEGADELFGGYSRFYHAAIRSKYQSLLPALNHLPYVGKKIKKRFGDSKYVDPIDWFLRLSAYQSAEHFISIRPENKSDRCLLERRAIFEEGKGDYLSNCLKYELKTYLVDCLIRQDKMTMAHSIENRVPFLDNELVTFVRNIPSKFLVEASIKFTENIDRNTKVLLKKLALKYFKPDFVYRQKAGFGLPLKSYFSNSHFKSIMRDLLIPGMRNRGIINADVVDKWLLKIENADNSTVESIWICVAFEIWAQQFLDGKSNFMCMRDYQTSMTTIQM